jgi:DNA polymerase-3 subunit alpha
MDRILGASARAHEAREVGQFSLFGDLPGGDEEDLLQSLANVTRVSPKEALEWEKELVGVYVSSHPLQTMTAELVNVVTHGTAEITEELGQAAVVIAGMITDGRQITTKKGDAMAFVRLEDLQGTIEVTVFPKLYQGTRQLWVTDKIVIVNGKTDVRNGRVSVLADSVRDYVEGMTVIEDTSSVAYRYRNGEYTGKPRVRESGSAQRPGPSLAAQSPAPRPGPAAAAGPTPSSPIYLPAEDEEGGYFGDENPFAGEEPDWLDDRLPEPAPANTDPRPAEGREIPVVGRPAAPLAPAEPAPGKALAGNPAATMPAADPPRATNTPGPLPPMRAAAVSGPAPQPAPGAAGEAPAAGAVPGPRTLRLTFRRSQSLEADRRRLSDLVDLLSRYPGEDRFVIVVEAGANARYELDFPNNRTGICRELTVELGQRLGTGNWQVTDPAS